MPTGVVMRPVALSLLALGLVLATGCRNACQQLCNEMADFAEECGHTVSKDELKACYKDNRRKSLKEAEEGGDTAGSGVDYDVGVCREISDSLREEWTCDEVAPYFDSTDQGATDDTGA